MHRSRLRRAASLLGVLAIAGVFVAFASSSGTHASAINPSPAWSDA
jgi:hypothetical protein